MLVLSTALAIAAGLLVTGPAAPSASAATANTSGLGVIISERGHLSTSYAAEGSLTAAATLAVEKPAGATVRRAVLFAATTGFTGATMSGPVKVGGTDVLMGHGTPSGINSYNYWSDITTLMQAQIPTASSGRIQLPVTEPSPENLVDGTAIAIIYDDPAKTTDTSVTLLFGALVTDGDNFDIALERPFDPNDPNAQMQMSLGISYSCEEVGPCAGAGQQYSTVDVNGKRLTSAAGGSDDGVASNGALITVGGVGDSDANPTDPNATPTGSRSDDELYDLKPFMKSGDTTVNVVTKNPSADDNVFFAAFTGNPPVSNIQTSAGSRFVYVALGDSYQSGEGAAFNVTPDSDYLTKGYENGSNYPPQTGPQDNTYTNEANPGGDSCHRALLNYAKINRDKFKPGAQVVLVDRTCSGATIEKTGGKPPIVGAVDGPGYASDSQVAQSVARLAGAGLSPADVDLVTVGMGGNDAKFGAILSGCLLPGLAKILLDAYPNSPGEIKWVASEFLNCSNLDKVSIHSDDAIKAVKHKEQWAQGQILSTFSNAKVLQLDYAIILPQKNSPEYCGGFQKDDVAFARKQGKKIDDAVRTTVAETAKGNPRIGLVETQDAFGKNALCPANAADQLGNGISKDNLDREITRLLNLDGTGDATVRGELDAVVGAYNSYKRCLADQFTLSTKHCNLTNAQNNVKSKVSQLLADLQAKQNDIEADLIEPTAPKAVGFDRSRGLYHPNDKGYAVLACNTLAVYKALSADDCLNAQVPPVSTVNGQFVGSAPIRIDPGQSARVTASGFQPNSAVNFTLFSEPISLGTVMADASGVVNTTVALPSVAAGVHLLNLGGRTSSGIQLTTQLPLQITGRPVGEYTTYMCGFQPEAATIAANAPTEDVTVTVNGLYLTNLRPNEDGCVLVFVPSVDQLTTSATITIQATSNLTGKTVSQAVDPIPTAASLWATSTTGVGIQITGRSFAAPGRVHSEGGISLIGSDIALKGGTEYATTYGATGTGINVSPAAAKKPAGQGAPTSPRIADYRPGGAIAKTSTSYRAIAPALCRGGVWTPTASDALSGIIYVPCSVALASSGRSYGATMVAEGKISVTGSNLTVGGTAAGTPSLVSAAAGTDAVTVTGSKVAVTGTIFAPQGSVRIAGASTTLTCGALAQSLVISGTSVTAPITERCSP